MFLFHWKFETPDFGCFWHLLHFKVLFIVLQEENEETSFILDKILNFIDWIITFCGGKYVETFHELRTEIEIQKIGFMLDI